MKHIFFVYLIPFNYLSIQTMQYRHLPQKYEHTKIAKRFFIIKRKINLIFEAIKHGLKMQNSIILEHQITQIPNINILTSLFAYAYEELKFECFSAQMIVDLELIKKDIQLCMQTIAEKHNISKKRFPFFGNSLKSNFYSILNNLEKREREERKAFQTLVDVNY